MMAAQLNRQCDCAVAENSGTTGFHADTPIFVDETHLEAIRELVASVHRVVKLPGWREALLPGAAGIAHGRPRALGVFTSFDFHVDEQGPQLIEINTNAGGALLNASAGWNFPACCGRGPTTLADQPERAARDFVDMFRHEWALARGGRPLQSIAIVDDDPIRQFLYPEFELFATLFRRNGIEAHIADARDLELREAGLFLGGRSIDLVYNRLTDFYLEEGAHRTLRLACEIDAAVVTPHPHAYALLADKRNLELLTDEEFLGGLNVSPSERERLRKHIPKTRRLTADESWWRDRKQWFFKPVSGFGSRGAYRGDKMTRGVFERIRAGQYVAQRVVRPGERRRSATDCYKVDLRAYTYDGRVQLMAARLYQGQTTNFRTSGGGFAPILGVRNEEEGERLWRRCNTP